jgi:hypothetical protein
MKAIRGTAEVCYALFSDEQIGYGIDAVGGIDEPPAANRNAHQVSSLNG